MIAAAPAFAQEQDIQRALMQRDQQSAGFALQLRQSQQTDTSSHLAERQKAADERVLLAGDTAAAAHGTAVVVLK
jgi:2-polyprenyl-6-methoxyphenol hydroxylase-like FAD-dependent oxidoreductase